MAAADGRGGDIDVNINALLQLEEDHEHALAELLESDEEYDDAEVILDAVMDGPAVRQRVGGYVEETVPGYLADDYRGHFRMTREQTETLLEDLGAHGAFAADDHGGMPPLSAKKATLVMLWTLANQDTIRSVADRFDVTKSSVIRTNRRLTSVLVGPLLQNHVKWPTSADAALAMDPTGTWKMVGAIDGSHIPIAQSVQSQEAYVNRKGFHSIVLQAVCQADMKFIDVFAGYPGSVHDARVFRNSPLSELLPQLCGEGYFIAGDSAYPLTGQLVTPFRDNGRLTRQQRKFNTELSKRRVVVERAFALLKGRFRRLKFLKMWGIADTVRTILAACVLHNMCLSAGDDGGDLGERDGVAEDEEAAAAAAVGAENWQVVGQDAAAFRERLMGVLLAAGHL